MRKIAHAWQRQQRLGLRARDAGTTDDGVVVTAYPGPQGS